MGAYNCLISHMFKCVFYTCELEMCFLHIQTLPETRSGLGSWPGSAIINGDPGEDRVKCLAHGHIDRF